MTANWTGAIDRARQHAPFLALALDRQPDLAELLVQGTGEEALAMARALGGNDDAALALRKERYAVALTLAIGDLAGAFSLNRVMAELSDLADRALDRAIRAAMLKRVPDQEPAGMIGLALGKQGAGELNYSSDIDPILLYQPDHLPRRRSDEPGEAAQRYAREVVEILSRNTADGYVFRVDLRLRPASEVSPLAISLDAAMSHYESSALAWERAAFIRARAAAGDIPCGESFLRAINPFVWRRSLDFGAIQEIRRLTARIRAARSGPDQAGPGWNLKIGRGGIREIEFFAQTHQLIHGGRNPDLRVRGTRAALDALAAAGHVTQNDATALGESYDRLRVVEHRLQMVEDQQTHSLPDGAALDNVAQLDGADGGAALVEELHDIASDVARRFDALIAQDEKEKAPAVSSLQGVEQLATELGYDEPQRIAARIEGWRDGRFRSLRSEAAQAAFDAMLPKLLEALSDVDDTDRVLLRWEAVLGKAPSAINLFRLLEARPALFDQLVHVLALAPPLADELGRRPDLLDTLIDRSALDLPGSTEALIAKMQGRSDARDDYEAVLDRIRIVTGETRFALGVQLIEAAHDPLDVARALCRTAEAALAVATDATAAEFAEKHGRIEDGEPVILGLGRFGGGELTHASDLDIVHLFTGAHDAESDGPRSLGATLYFNRLAQRIGGALSVPTAQGALYEVDTRLRPQGAQGPLAVSLDAFDRYQREDAWTWEHMALTRARVIVGSQSARDFVNRVINAILGQERAAGKLRNDVLSMREEMARHKPGKGSLDAKLLRGGLVDLEFLVHFLQLRERTGLVPDLSGAIASLVERELLSSEIAEAKLLMTRLLVASRLVAPDLEIPSAIAGRALARACGYEDEQALRAGFQGARFTVAQEWRRIFDEELEIEG